MPLNQSIGRRAVVRSLLLSSLILVGAGGCAIPSAFLYKFMGPGKIPPKYVVPQQPLLLLVENAHSGSVAMPEADALARVVYDDLAEHKVAPLIDPVKIHDLRDQNPNDFARWSIAEIGRRLGAKQVLYLHVDHLDIEAAGAEDIVRLKIGIRAKVIDVATAQTSWPQSGETESYNYESPLQRVEPGASTSGLNQQVLRQSGQEIARWFYAYEPETMREENKDVRLR